MMRVRASTAMLLSAAALSGCSGGSAPTTLLGDASKRPVDSGHDARVRHDAVSFDAPREAKVVDAGSDGGDAQTLAFGSGLVATLTPEGQLTVTSNGMVLLGTSPGVPLFSSASDPADPTGWHDPDKLQDDTFVPLSPAAIAMDTPSAGVLHFATTDLGPDTVLVSLALASDSGFYTGLGERYDHVDPRGEIVGMQLELDESYESGTTDRHVPVPWLVSSNGYGIFVKDRQAGAWDVASTDPAVVRSTFEGTTLDVTIVVNPDPIAIVATLTQMNGLQRHTPLWALAPMMWRHAQSQAQVLGDLAQIRSLHIPTTTFWIDDGWQTAMNTLDFDPAEYDDPTMFTASMASLGFKLLGWNSPYLLAPQQGQAANEAQALYPGAADAGYFVEQNGKPFQALGPGSGPYGMLDFTSAGANVFWDERAGVPVATGIDGFKLDYGEDLIPAIGSVRLGVTLSDGETERTARNYPLVYHGAYRSALAGVGRPTNDGGAADAGADAAGIDAGASDDGVLIVRASTYGGAAVADIVWPGDLDNGFQQYGQPDDAGTLLVGGLPASIIAAQTLSVCGFALYGADTGGYRGGAPTLEALIRWAEHTSLSMVMQLGPGEDKYPWLYDGGVAPYTSLANLHQALVPYLAGLLTLAEASGTPPIRPLPLAYPKDQDAPAFADAEYLLGPSLLVAPVVTSGVTSRQVHLPPGVWFPYWGGTSVTGPTTRTVAAPLGQPPLFVLAGTLLPLLPPGIDTLVTANDPSTVSLSQMPGLDDAMAWVSGPASAQCLDGSQIAVTDVASGVTVSWSPTGTGQTLSMTVELSARLGGSTAPSQVVVVTGAPLSEETSAAAVLSATGSAWYLSGAQATLKLVGAAAVTFE
jgi:alpha-glucosidase (family GH31 glycosyl hydrolase)